MAMTERVVAGQDCWTVTNESIELNVTKLGGHMAPVVFSRNTGRPIQPYYVSPWQDERRCDIGDPVLRPLRGDFFCCPFGANEDPVDGVQHTCHGQPATDPWTLEALDEDAESTTLRLSMETTKLAGRIEKELTLAAGQSVVYCRHTLSGFSAATSLGHHATLAVPDDLGGLRVATSPYRFGMTLPYTVDDTVDPWYVEYHSLAPGERFEDLADVPLAFKDPARGDLTRFPARRGYTDLAAVFHEPSDMPVWTTATVASGGYVWFSLKDVAVQPNLLLWIANRGRHCVPWMSRNRCLGLEDVCGYFAAGIGPSTQPNLLNEEGIRTATVLSPETPTVVSYIQGAVAIPEGFDVVADVAFGDGEILLRSASGLEVVTPVDWEFVQGGE